MIALIARSSDGRRAFYLWQDPPTTEQGTTSGWNFAVEENSDDGEVRPVFDTWHETLDEILMYPPSYSDEPLHWQDETTGNLVDPAALSRAAS